MRKKSRNQPCEIDPRERADELTLRAYKLRRRGELRKSVLCLREACGLDEANAARWMILGVRFAELGKRDDAERSMKQSLFLRERAGEKAKANVVRGLLLKLARVARQSFDARPVTPARSAVHMVR